MNQLHFGDNLDVLRQHVKDESPHLIYLDPPFNSKATYKTEETKCLGIAANLRRMDGSN